MADPMTRLVSWLDAERSIVLPNDLWTAIGLLIVAAMFRSIGWPVPAVIASETAGVLILARQWRIRGGRWFFTILAATGVALLVWSYR